MKAKQADALIRALQALPRLVVSLRPGATTAFENLILEQVNEKVKSVKVQHDNGILNESSIVEIDKLFPEMNQTWRSLPDFCNIKSSLKILLGYLVTIFRHCQEDRKRLGIIDAADAYLKLANT